MEIITLGAFVCSLLLCVISDISIVVALLIGFVLFFTYALYKDFSLSEVLTMFKKGVLKVKNVVFTLLIIGILTAVWRGSGTIAFIIYYASKLIMPNIFILITFFLCSIVSFLIGTAFGTAATIGTICMTMGVSLGLSKSLIGGAIISGIYFGDRSSPMSTSALLVSEVTRTNIFDNIKNMLKSAFVPFIITSILYLLIGFFVEINGEVVNVESIFEENFNLSVLTVIPAIIILVLSFFKVDVKKTMLISVLCASLICLFIQGNSIYELLNTCIYGFSSDNKELSNILSGGGIISMLKVIMVVCISSSYAGIFESTDLIKGLKSQVIFLANKFSVFGSMIIVSIFTSMISCNQTLAIMLTEQLTNDLIKDKSKLALKISNTVVVIAGLVPWSIAANVPLSSIDAPDRSLFFALYLMVIPLYNLIYENIFCKKENICIKHQSSQEF